MKKKSFYHFRTLSKKLPVLCPNFPRGIFKTAFYLSRETVWWIFFFEKFFFFLIFGQRAKNLLFVGKKGGLVRTAFYVSMRTFEEIFCEKLFNFLSVSYNIRHFLAFCQNLFRQVIPAEFYLSIEAIWRKRVFLRKNKKIFPINFRHWAKLFGFWSKNFLQCVKPALYVSIEIFSWIEVFWKNKRLFKFFGSWVKYFWLVVGKNSKGWSKLQLTVDSIPLINWES